MRSNYKLSKKVIFLMFAISILTSIVTGGISPRLAEAQPSSVTYSGTFSLSITHITTDPNYWPTFREQKTATVSADFSNFVVLSTYPYGSTNPSSTYNGAWSLASPISNGEYTKTFNPTSGQVSGTFGLGLKAEIKNGVISFTFQPDFSALNNKITLTETRSYMPNEPLEIGYPFDDSPSKDIYYVLNSLAVRTGDSQITPPTSSNPYVSQTVSFSGSLKTSPPGLVDDYTWQGSLTLTVQGGATQSPSPTPTTSSSPSPTPKPTPTSNQSSGNLQVTFTASDLPANTSWWVALDGYNKSSVTSEIVFFKDPGSYRYYCGINNINLESQFLLELVGTRSTTSGTTSQTGMGFVNYSSIIPIADDFFVDGAAVKPDTINIYDPSVTNGIIVVDSDANVQVQIRRSFLTITDTITMHYTYPDGTSLIRTAQADFTPASLGGYSATSNPETYAQTFDVLHTALLQNHAGRWRVQATAEIKLSSPSFSQTILIDSNTLNFTVIYASQVVNLPVNIAGVPNFVTTYLSDGASITNPQYTSNGRDYGLGFTITGPEAAPGVINEGTVTLAIPTSVIPAGYNPQVTVGNVAWTQTPDNGQPLPRNSWRWDFASNNYYIYITLHFSTEQVEIFFENPQAQTAEILSPTLLVTAIVVVAVIGFTVVLVVLRRLRSRRSLPPPPPPPD